MNDNQTIKEKKRIRFVVNGRKPDGIEFWFYYLWRLLSLVVIAVVVYTLSESINLQIALWTRDWAINSTDIYKLLSEHPDVNLFIFIWGLIGIAFYIKKNWENKYISLFGIWGAIISSILVLHQDVWVYARTPLQALGYDWFVFFIAVAFILWSFLRCFSYERLYSRKTRKKVMTSDETKDVDISSARLDYAKMLVDELLTSNLKSETYAVAITGSWGSGKTLFLNTVKTLCKDKAILVDFNPWNSQTADHLAKDFFNTLSEELSPYYGGVRKTMDKYVSLLYSLRFHVASNFIIQHFPGSKESSLETKKQEVANALRSIQKPIVVAIDDLDRLAGREIFEVLRIIRNTAKFNNIIYIVTYDKGHVINQLKQPELGIEKDYLEKIFQIELSMPEVDEKELEEEFKLLCRKGVKKTSQINAALTSLTDDDYRQIIKVLWSFRKVKRFVRRFSFNSNFIVESFIGGQDLPLRDVLFLNLIQSIDHQLYQKMWLNPEELFEVRIHPSSKCQYYALRNDVVDKSSAKYFLQQLFGGVPGSGRNVMQMLDSYFKYFYLSQPGKALSMDEFNEMLKLPPGENAVVGMRATIRGWVLSKDAKNAPSIYACFANSSPKVHDDPTEAKTFLTALFYWLEYEDRVDANLEAVLPRMLRAQSYNISSDQQLDAFVMSLLNKWLYKGNYEKCAKVLSHLYVEIGGGKKLLLDKQKVEKAINTNINLFLKSQEWDAVLLFRTDDNPMLRMAKAYCVKEKSVGKRINLVIDQMIAFFSIPKNKSQNQKSVEKYRDAFASYSVYGKMADSSINWDDMISTFGEDLSKAIDYIDKCFRPANKPSNNVS